MNTSMKKYFLFTLSILVSSLFFANTSSAATLPGVSTGGTSWVFTTSVDFGISITSLGGDPSVISGVQYGTAIGVYGSTISGGTVTATGTRYARAGHGVLTCSTTYYYRAFATNSAGTSYGAPATVTTNSCTTATIPSALTVGSSVLSPTSATINGNITSSGGVPVLWRGFQYWPTGGATVDSLIAGSFATGPFSRTLTGLSCGTTYNYRALIANTVFFGSGSTLTFTTPPCVITITPPTVTTTPATAPGVTTATLNGNLTGLGGASNATASFEYGTTTAYGSNVTATSPTQPMSITGVFSRNLTGLTCATTYHFRAKATNTAGSAYGIDRTFTTLACPVTTTPPAVTTDPVTTGSVTMTFAILNGTLTSMGGATAVSEGFEYGTTTAYGSTYTVASATVLGTFTGGPSSLLVCNTLYHYRAFATNSAGTAYGIDRTFTTLPCPITVVSPTVITTTATPVGVTSATLNGSITATGGANATTVGFNWGTAMTVAGTGGAFVSTTVGGPFGVGAFGIPVSGLACNTLYHYRAWATNSAGTNYGADMTFTTGPCPVVPTVTTLSPSAISMISGVLHGNLGSLGGAVNTTASFEYGTTTAYGSTITATSPVQPMTAIGGFNVNLTGLVCGTTYHYRAKGTNSTGSAYGADMTLTTLPCPISVVPPAVLTVAATSVTATGATLNGNLTSVGGVGIPTTVDFLWDLTTATGYSNSASAGIMTAPGVFNATISGLACSTAYIFFAQATNSAGTVYDAPLTFTTLPCPITITPPTVTTTPATAPGVTTATLNGNLTGLGGASNATASFEYGTTTVYGSTVTATTPTQPMTATGVFSRNLTGLTCATTYHFRAKATNSAGSAYGIDRTFTTLACPVTTTPPAVTTDPVSALTTSSATLNGTLTSLGGISSATTVFEYGLTTAYGSTASFGTMTAVGSFSKNITGLACGTPYNFRAKATNSMGSVYGINRVFITTSCPVTPTPPTVATTSGTVLSYPGSSTTVDFVGNLLSLGAGVTSATTGFYYGPSTTLTSGVGSTSVTFGTMSAPGSYNTTLTVPAIITCNEPWHIRAWATNGGITVTGSDISFCNV